MSAISNNKQPSASDSPVSKGTGTATVTVLTERYTDVPNQEAAGSSHRPGTSDSLRQVSTFNSHAGRPMEYRVYRRRWLGLVQLVLLNIVVSWDWLTFAAVSGTSSEYFRVSESAINWLSTGFLFAFAAAAPAVIWVLNHYGPKMSIVVASALVLIGNWIRYAGTRANNGHGDFGVVMFGQIIIGLAQPFVLAAPTRYSQTWFSDRGRVSATALASLANPFGGALGQLIGPFWAEDISGIPNMVLYTSITSTVAALPAIFIPAKPPTPPSATAAAEKLDLRQAFCELPGNASFFLILIPFSVYVGFFNATSSLINQIFEPYGFSETDAGIAGALLIVVGLVASAIVSPIIDRTKAFLLAIKLLVPLIAASYTILIFMPQTRQIAGPYVVCALLGATSFSLLPTALELLTIVTHPVSPEVSSVLGWVGGQILGAVFIIIMDALQGTWSGEPPESLKSALAFQALMSWIVVPFPMLLGIWKFRKIVIGNGIPDEGPDASHLPGCATRAQAWSWLSQVAWCSVDKEHTGGSLSDVTFSPKIRPVHGMSIEDCSRKRAAMTPMTPPRRQTRSPAKPPRAPKKAKPYIGASQKPSPTTPTRAPKHKKGAKRAPRAGSLKRINLDARNNTELQRFIRIRETMGFPMTRSGHALFEVGNLGLFELP
ncbi:hypothetical protein AC579_1018 [Pseudocercospora musae]|uniref:Major facilitator superfamily (MFS) profile domain-containing protein n=1 Tax=Pseudocercospora musae TaxID=113226 RepID=A0A139HRF4_9PEZI|nr:hypothetical protein AC579_1018 [Pseudocercospora musae]